MKTADPELMRAINRFHVMDVIRRYGPISRVEICERLQLSPTTVSAITGALIDDALIMPRQEGAVRDPARGRPRVMLELNPEAAFVVGVKLAPDQITVAVTNFRADILESLTLPIRIDRQPIPVIADLVEDGVRRCVADADLPMARIAGLCLGLPGLIVQSAGLCRQSPLFGERDVAFGPALSERLGIPVLLDTDVNLVTLAEHWFGHGRGLDDFMVVSIEHSLGLGIMHRGEIFRGASGLSPDLGDLLVQQHDAERAGIERLSAVASGAAIAAKLHDRLRRDGEGAPPSLRRLMARLRERVEGGDREAATVAAAAGEALGFAVANLVALFAPPRVILAGTVLEGGEALLRPLRETIPRLTPPGLGDIAEIVVQGWEETTWARGAAAMMLRELYGSPWGTTGPAERR
ncbi:ROK family transcriptional regulator [Arenibaculum pallidiluteum]|uniref:ROK family transcriptional regulator n=1 Tax=Arenibaculum pallidiluteum TaxID=2812559 RepID=UPI001A9573A3|nr:ROK family transcriptional regulator [Arenibaculum pallidiluteum]